MNKKQYPGIIERIKAVAVDTFVILTLMIVFSFIFSNLENLPNKFRIVAFVFIFYLYDPIFTSLFGGTIGHLLIGLRVRKEIDTNKKILFHFALIRFTIKSLLGMISLFTVMGNEKRKAIHDFASGSVVIKY